MASWSISAIRRRTKTTRSERFVQDLNWSPQSRDFRLPNRLRPPPLFSFASQEQAIVGKTPNLAARLQGIAAPSTVVIADSTRKLLGGLFELEDLGGKDLKGIEGPERVWAVLRANPVDSRFDAFHTTGVTELVGRQEELELLLRRWTKAVTGEGQVVVLSGEPGIGKSRLTAALLERLSTEPHALAILLFTAAYRQRLISNHHADGAGCGICARRYGPSET